MATNPTNFDVAGARQAGYSDDEILDHLAKGSKFDVAGARKAGYGANEILDHLRGMNSVTLPPPDPNAALKGVPRPNTPMNEQYLLGGGDVQPLGKQLVEQAKGTGAAIGNMAMMAPTAIHRSMQSAGLMRQGNAFQQEHTMPQVWQQDVPNAVVTVAGAEPSEPAIAGRGRAMGSPPPPPPEVALAPEQQAAYTAALDKANAPYVKQLAAEDLAGRQRGIAERLQQNVQQTHETVRNGLNARWDSLREKVGDAPVQAKPIIEAIDKSRQMLAGTPANLKIFNQIVQNLDQRGAEDLSATTPQNPEELKNWIAERADRSAQPASSIPFGDARTQYSALGEQWSNADGNLRRALKNAYDAYGKQIETTAEAKGAGGEYSDLKRDWSQYVNDWQGKSPLAKVRNAAHPAYVTPIVKGVGSDLLAEQMSRYQDAGADPSAVAEMKAVTKQGKLGQLKPVPVPTPEPPEPGLGARLASHMPRVIGKVLGGSIGSAVGHPLIGYSVGGEVGSELGKKMTARPAIPAIPRTPEEYTRTILAAKEGQISGAEANRRITRGGGKVTVQPIPPPPQ
jgi:hypothetical protein